MTRWISLISSGDNLGEMSTGKGFCAFAPYCLGGRGGRTMLRFSWHAMFVFQQEFFDVSRHGHVKPSLFVIPFEGDPAIKIARQILCDFVCFFYAPYEMLHMFFTNIFHSEIINNQSERYRSPLVLPKTGRIGAFIVSVWE